MLLAICGGLVVLAGRAHRRAVPVVRSASRPRMSSGRRNISIRRRPCLPANSTSSHLRPPQFLRQDAWAVGPPWRKARVHAEAGRRPGKQAIAVLLNPDTPFSASALREVKSAAEQRRRTLEVYEARTTEELLAGIETAVKTSPAGLILLEDPLILGAKRKIVELVAAARLPTIYGLREFTDAGGLASYGPDLRQNSRRGADYVDKVLRGARPADLPVEQPTKFEFVINLKTAKELGLVPPPTLLGLADEVIE